jgi:predicted nucleotidyltransferase
LFDSLAYSTRAKGQKGKGKPMSSPDHAQAARLRTFADQAARILRTEERARLLWLTGSLAAGTADARSDVDLRLAMREDDFATIGQWWPGLIDLVASTVWKRRYLGPPDEAILGAITTDYLRFDLVVQSVADTKPRRLEAAQVP